MRTMVLPVHTTDSAQRLLHDKYDLFVPIFMTGTATNAHYEATFCDYRPMAAQGYSPVVVVVVYKRGTFVELCRFHVRDN